MPIRRDRYTRGGRYPLASWSVSVRPNRETADLMCGRFTSSQAIGERFEVVVPETYQHRFNLVPSSARRGRLA